MAGRSILIKFIGDSKGLNDAADGVTGRLGKIKGAIGEADGFFGKLKAGGGAALESVGGAGAIAAAGVAAAAAAAYKGVNDFKDLGIEVGHFVDATGAAPEAASRLIEVAGDVGISAGELEGSIGKMNKAAAATPQLFKDLGVDIVKTKDGLVDTNATFLNAVDRLNAIEDPTKRAEAASKLFGRGWQGMAELIGQGTPKLKASLAAVSDAKVFDQKKLDDARGLRDAFDQIGDAAQDLFLMIGQALAPVINDLAPIIAENVENVKPLVEGFGKLLGALLKVVGPIAEITNKIGGPFLDAIGAGAKKLGELIDAVSKLGKEALDTSGLAAQVLAMKDAKGATEDLTTENDDLSESLETQQAKAQAARDRQNELKDAVDRGKDAIALYRGELDKLNGTLDNEEAYLNLQQNLDDTQQKIADLWKAEADGQITHEESVRQQKLSWIGLKQDTIDYGTQIGLLPKDIQTLVTLIDNGNIDEMERRLGILTRNRTFAISFQQVSGGDTLGGDGKKRAKGGPVRAGQAYVVGENPDGSLNSTSELFVPNTSGTIIPAGGFGVGSGSGAAGSGRVTIQVFGAEPSYVRDIDRTITRLLRGMQ